VLRDSRGPEAVSKVRPSILYKSLSLCSRQVLPHEREVAGALMTFFLALGLSCGASLSFLFKALL
jgi:hypothetical protein